MARGKIKKWLITLACGGFPLITSATCDPYAGVLDFYRDDDIDHHGGLFYEDIYYYEEDCFLFFCF